MTRRVWDISQTLRPALPVWPGDTAFACERTWDMAGGSPVNVSRLTLSTHSGTHADAPLHYVADGLDAASMALEPYLGECLVVDARGLSGAIDVADLPDLGGVTRLLLRTWDAFPHDRWRSHWTAIAAETIDWLAGQGVVLVGTDAPSLDPESSKTMDAHHAIARADMRILEGLVLDDVPAGRYELIALPAKIAGGDAGVCRAILREIEHA